MIFIKTNNIVDLIAGKNIVIPNYIVKYYKDLKLDLKEMLFVSYLISFNKEIPFDINSFSKDLNLDNSEIMNIIGKLCENNLISMNVKQDKNILKEYIDISLLTNKIASFIIKENVSVSEEVPDADIYSDIEKEFGRPLSPIEYETIKGWIDAKINPELIHEALKEAVLNGVSNLKYIDKILFEWTKKGYKKKSDIKRKTNNVKEDTQVFEYDWLKDNE